MAILEREKKLEDAEEGGHVSRLSRALPKARIAEDKQQVCPQFNVVPPPLLHGMMGSLVGTSRAP